MDEINICTKALQVPSISTTVGQTWHDKCSKLERRRRQLFRPYRGSSARGSWNTMRLSDTSPNSYMLAKHSNRAREWIDLWPFATRDVWRDRWPICCPRLLSRFEHWSCQVWPTVVLFEGACSAFVQIFVSLWTKCSRIKPCQSWSAGWKESDYRSSLCVALSFAFVY